MKRYLALLLVLCCMLTLAACQKSDNEDVMLAEHFFEATVLEVHDTYLLVEPAEGTWERNSADKIEVSLLNKTSWPIPRVGDTVNVVHSGEIMETYPARLGKLYRVEIIN